MKVLLAFVTLFFIGTVLSLAVSGALFYAYGSLLIATLKLSLPVLTFWQIFGITLFLSSLKTVFETTKPTEKKDAEETIDQIKDLVAKRLGIAVAIALQTLFWVSILG